MAKSVLVGMSGGVDSSLTAGLLKAEGYYVEGLSLRLFESRGQRCASSCCSLEAIGAAAASASVLGIAHHMMDSRDAFLNNVVEPFMESYLRGATPNPCIICNARVKFPALIKEAARRGFDYIATGHYARVEREGGGGGGGGVRLLAGRDARKDQSYFLYVLDHDTLGRLLLPLGGLEKPVVRAHAREMGLPVFDRPESQEICFAGQGEYGDLIEALEPGSVRPGPVLGPDGHVLGQHRGIVHYTVGQRRGLGVALGYPAYVTAIDAANNTVHVGPLESVMAQVVKVREVNWLVEVAEGMDVSVKIRSAMRPARAYLARTGPDTAEVRFEEPQFGVAPEQAAVFYDGDVVVGGGLIYL